MTYDYWEIQYLEDTEWHVFKRNCYTVRYVDQETFTPRTEHTDPWKVLNEHKTRRPDKYALAKWRIVDFKVHTTTESKITEVPE